MKILGVIICCTTLLGCLLTYDPESGALSIQNRSTSVVYVYATCNDSLPCSPELKLYESLGDNVFDAEGKKITDTLFSPNYRIGKDSVRFISVDGTPKKPRVFCDDGRIRLFFITATVMKSATWTEICKDQKFAKKLTMDQRQLDSLGWEIIYK